MLAELGAVLAAVPIGSRSVDYRAAILQCNVLGKTTDSKADLGYALLLKRYAPNVVDASDAQIKQAAAVKQLLSALGAIPIDMTPAELGAFLKTELAKWTEVIRTRGIQPE